MHYKTFDVIDVEPGEFVSKVEAAGRRAAIVEPGASITLE
jgi:hypothetical protein